MDGWVFGWMDGCVERGMGGWMDDNEGELFPRTPLCILKLPRLNEHDLWQDWVLIWNTHPSSAAEPKWTPPVKEMGVDAEGKILHLRPPLGVSRPKRTLGESGVLRARTPLEFLSDTNGSIHDLTLSEVGSGPVGKNTQCPCGLLRLSS